MEVPVDDNRDNADGYRMSSCRNGTAWLIIPQDVQQVVLELLHPALEKAGWSCSSQGERCDVFSLGTICESQVKLFTEGGRLLVCHCEKDMATRVASLYIDILSEAQ